MLQRNFNPNIQINLSIFFFTNFKVKKRHFKKFESKHIYIFSTRPIFDSLKSLPGTWNFEYVT